VVAPLSHTPCRRYLRLWRLVRTRWHPGPQGRIRTSASPRGDHVTAVRFGPSSRTCAKLAEDILGATRQYSSGSRVVTDRSASVIIHSFSPASVW
jgi:hypothetical protein